MVVEVVVKLVHCDRCSNSTSAYSKFDTMDFRMPTALEIREGEDYHRVFSAGKYIDLCPSCYAKFKGTGVMSYSTDDKELEDMLRKYLGLAPYNGDENISRGDSWYYKSIVDKFGSTAIKRKREELGV